jgi:hypothetical protein
MSLLSSAQSLRRGRGSRHGHRGWIAVASVLSVGSIAAVVYLLWPTWRPETASGPDRTPVSVGGTLFNVPTKAFRVKLQRHSGPQERVDLNFDYPSLEPPDQPRHASADTFEQAAQTIDRIFLSIAAHHDTLPPDVRLRTIYPRYLVPTSVPEQDGLTQRAFRDGSPYAGEDLFTATAPELAARCTRDGITPGMCLSERRIAGADLTFRFPRAWLSQWREVAAAADRLSSRLHGPHG